jgi:hypothetical protein
VITSSQTTKSNFFVGLSSYWSIAWTIVALIVVAQVQMPRLATIKAEKQGYNKLQLERETQLSKQQLSAFRVLPGLGYDNLLADIQFIDLLQYIGDTDARMIVGYESLFDRFEVILDRDPRFLNAYYMLGGTGSVDGADPRRSVELIDRHLPKLTARAPERAYYIWRTKSVDELLFLNRTDQAKRSLQMAVAWTKEYGNDPDAMNAGRVSEVAIASLNKNPGSKKAKTEAWKMILNNLVDARGNVSNPKAFQRAVNEIRNLGGEVRINAEGQIEILNPEAD